MEKLSIIIILAIIAIVVTVFLKKDTSTEKNWKPESIENHIPMEKNKDLATCSPYSFTITVKDINGNFIDTRQIDYEEIRTDKEYLFGRKTPKQKSQVWFPLESNGNIIGREHFSLFKQIDKVNGEDVVRFGVFDNNSKNGTYARSSEEEEWMKIDIVELRNGTEIRAGELIISFSFNNFYDEYIGKDDEDIKIFDLSKNKHIGKRLPSMS